MEDRILLRKPRKYPKGSSVILHENDDEYVTHIEDKFDNRHSRHTGNYFHKSGLDFFYQTKYDFYFSTIYY